MPKYGIVVWPFRLTNSKNIEGEVPRSNGILAKKDELTIITFDSPEQALEYLTRKYGLDNGVVVKFIEFEGTVSDAMFPTEV